MVVHAQIYDLFFFLQPLLLVVRTMGKSMSYW